VLSSTVPTQVPTPGTSVYRPRRPARTVLHKTVRHHLETYLEAQRDGDFAGPMASSIEAAFRAYLKCGILAHGFARAYCPGCGHDFLVAFSCKGRDICPSCATRRMVETAAHLIDHVLPRVAFRQWVLSVPKRVRWHMREKPEVASGLLRVFLRAVETTLRQHSPGAPSTARFGAVAFVHRFGSFLNSHVHYHVLVTDGVFSPAGDGETVFHPALSLDAQDIVDLQTRMRARGLRYLQRHGHLDNAAVHSLDAPEHAGGWSVDASVCIPEWDRQGLERLVRYCARPPLSAERLEQLDDTTLVYHLRKPTLDGHTELILTPLELLDRLSKLITPPRIHKHRYYGVLASNAHLRRAVIASAGPAAATQQLLEQAKQKMALKEDAKASVADSTACHADPPSALRRAAAHCWALLLVRIYECLPLLCPRCGEPMRLVAFIQEPAVIETILRHIGEPSEAPKVLPARAPPQGEMEFDTAAGLEEWPDVDQTAGSTDDSWD
jgi:hypothetical protein